MRFTFALTIAAMALTAPAFAQSDRHSAPSLPSQFRTGTDRPLRNDCPDVERGEQQATFDDTYGCWSSISASQPVDGSWLDVRIKPAFALVYVNGTYAGTAQQFTRPFRPLILGTGPQQVEFRAPGYRSLSFWITRERGTISTASGALTKLP